MSPSEQKSIVLVHGFMGDPSDWDFIKQELADLHVVTPLIRPAENWDAGVAQLAGEIPSGALLVGYSMGARLSLGVACAFPGLIRGLLFCSGNPGMEDEAKRENRYRHDLNIAQDIDTCDRREFLHRWYTESTVFKSLTETVREDEIRRKATRTADDWSAILRCYSVARQPNYWPQLPELDVPMMAVAGAADRKYARFISRMGALPEVDARTVAECGHIVHREQPHVFLQLVRSFVEAC